MNTIRLLIVLVTCIASLSHAQVRPDTLRYTPFIWESAPPSDCPFEPSKDLSGIRFLGVKSGFRVGDTWYPSWAADGKLYSPYTDGRCPRLDGGRDLSISDGNVPQGYGLERTSTGNAVIDGEDPLAMTVYSLGVSHASSLPYHGRYPAGSLVHNGVWYYGTYCLDPAGSTTYGEKKYNWPWMGPFVGFRTSTDNGRSWKECPHTPSKPLFGETGLNGYPVKIGSPHFVDFGRNMEHSPDGKAYLVAHGADTSDTKPRFYNDSWITGDQVYLLRVEPTVGTINDYSKYEFYAGTDAQGAPVWSREFAKIKPLLEWNNNMGCVTVTYNAPLKKYLMCVTDGGNTCAKMNSYILESGALTGPWRLVTYLKDFGEQAYFVNFPSKFIGADGTTAWMLYSGNFAVDWNGMTIAQHPPGSHYGMVFQKIEFLR